ncbi:fructose PTS transporter subunit IIA, partial [Nocardia sp. NPDC058497]|uniref:fructose PTS transporter subunit IIA n=1 Tax=Nocardia sp. NPDC058497 TaxID=3346529 RepID=UPI0036526439
MADSIITTDLITLDADLGADKDAVITTLAGTLAATGRASDADAVSRAALDREAQSATGLPGGIAIPHCRAAAVTTASLAFARLSPKVDFGAPDGPADLVFLIAAPEGAGAEHMQLLSSLARALVRPAFVADLRSAATPADVVGLVEGVINPPPATTGTAAGTTGTAAGASATGSPAVTGGAAAHGAGAAGASAGRGDTSGGAGSAAAAATAADANAAGDADGTETAGGATPGDSAGATGGSAAAGGAGATVGSAGGSASGARPKIVAVTACPTGIAHTYMAADSLVAAGERAGVKVAVETQGSSGGDKLDPAIIAAADAVIFATDVGVQGRGRFAGKPVVESGVKRAINEPDTMIAEAVTASTTPGAATVGGAAPPPAPGAGQGPGGGARPRPVRLT